jgi:hemoglobin
MFGRVALSSVAAAVIACTVSSTGAAAQGRTLYERLGGYPAIQAVVDETINNVAADKRINKFFAGANIPRLRQNLSDQI